MLHWLRLLDAQMLHIPPFHHKSVSNHPPVTPPPEGFAAHNCTASAFASATFEIFCQGFQFIQSYTKSRGTEINCLVLECCDANGRVSLDKKKQNAADTS